MKAPRRPAAPAKTPRAEIEPCTPNSCGHEKIPPQWAWHHRTLLRLRDRLLAAHAEHTKQAAAPLDRETNDFADTAQERAERDRLWAELGAENDRLFEIDCALQRIRDGVYGLCEVTGHPIPLERLRAVPWARYSRAAAAALEARSSGAR